MTATITYKGETLATAHNNTKVLETEGMYLEDDITITDVTSGTGTLITKLISANGTYNASDDSADGYSSVTVNVSGGGTTPVTQKQINFIDYDGTLLYSYTKAEIEAMIAESDLPSNPTHTGLTSQGWNWTLAQIKAQLTAIPDEDVWVGQNYVTSDGKTRIDITLSNRRSPYFSCAVNGTITIDWGDGSTSTLTGTSLTTRKSTSHSYASSGDYTITITVNSGSFAFFGTTAYTVLNNNSSTTNKNNVYSSDINNIRLGSNVSIGDYGFTKCYNLKTITIPAGLTSIGKHALSDCHNLLCAIIPKGITTIEEYTFQITSNIVIVSIPSTVTSIGPYAFRYDVNMKRITLPFGLTSFGEYAVGGCNTLLKSITIPCSLANYAVQNTRSIQKITVLSGATSIGDYAFTGNHALKDLELPNTITSIGTHAFDECYAIESITIPSGVTSIGSYAFSGCYGAKEYHIKPTTVPTLGSSAFSNIPSDCVIYVPSAQLSTYKSASNWSTYKNYMQGE